MNSITNKNRVTIEEMKAYYAKNFPYAANNQRVGRFAKQMGFCLAKQMIQGKTVRFYIKIEPVK